MWFRSLGWEDPWSRKWQSTPVFSPGKLHGQRSLEGYSPWGHKELNAVEHALLSHSGCFQLMAILNTSTMNILKHAFLCHYLLVLLLEVELDIR